MPRLRPANVHFKTLRFLSTHHPLDEIPHRTPVQLFPSRSPIQTIRSLLHSNAELNTTTVSISLKFSDKKSGAQIHGLVLSSGLDSFTPISNSLMNMYSKSGSFDIACKIFTQIQNPDVVSWNTILSGFNSGVDALGFVLRMHWSGVSFDAVSLTMALAFSADLQELEFGWQVHCLVFKSGFEFDTFVGNSLVTAYSRSACIGEAKRVFDEMRFRDLVSWNALMSGLTQEGNFGSEVIRVFVRMMKGEERLRPDHVSFSSVISACGQERSFEFGRQVHSFATKVGLEDHVSVANVIMSMYYKHGFIDCAERVFKNMRGRNVISWTTLISMDEENAVQHFNSMRLDGVQPNDVTFVALIYAISAKNLLREGQMIHGVCFKTGISAEVNVSNSLVSMYGKLESMDDSRKVFEEMNYKEIISWNSLISGYAQNGQCEKALKAFSSSMLHCMPNQYTFGSILSVITAVQTVSLTYGQRCHCRIIKQGLNTDEYVSGALIDLYSKHGSIEESQRAFDETIQKSLISWTAIISAHSKHGSYGIMMKLFEEMVNSGVQPDHITFLAVLVACGGKGMVDVGRQIFDAMISEYGLEPWPEHYGCMVDMLGRAGRLAEAEDLVKRIPKGPGVSALQSLLGACRVHGDVQMGERVAKTLMETEPTESGAYVLMSNLYADKGEWESVAKVRKGMRQRGVKKEVGFSWVDVGNRESTHMHKFSSDDSTHPLADEIYRMAECLGSEMKLLVEAKGLCHLPSASSVV